MSLIKTKSRLALVACALLVAVAIAALGLRGEFSKASAASDAVRLADTSEAKPMIVEMGEVLGGQTGDKIIRVRNTGSAPMKLTGKTGCGCTTVTPVKPSLDPGEETDVKITYASNAQFNHHGAIVQHFTIVDEAAPEPRIVLWASLNAFVRPSLVFPFNRVIWDVAGSGLDLAAKTLTVTNTLDAPVSMKFRPMSGSGVTLDVIPSEFNFAPHQSIELKFDRVRLGDAVLPYASILRFESSVKVGDQTVPLQHNLPMSILSRQVLTAIPGSLLFSPNDLSSKTAKKFTLQRAVEKGLVVSEVTSGDPRLRITPAGKEGYSVQVDPALAQESLSTTIHVTFQYQGQPSSIDVPVYAYRNGKGAPGPTPQGGTPAKL
jgi:hypothetical protein